MVSLLISRSFAVSGGASAIARGGRPPSVAAAPAIVKPRRKSRL
jgi:hypothetical protein